MLELPVDPEISARLSSADLSAAELAGLDTTAGHLVITPFKRLDNGKGVYSSSTMFIVKELRADGLTASFLDPPERRTFDVRKSAVADVVTLSLSVGGSLTTNLVWFYLVRLLSRGGQSVAASGETEIEVTVVDPLAPPESNRLVLRGKPDVVLRAASEISHRNPPALGQPSSEELGGDQ